MNENYQQSWYDRVREDQQAEREAIVSAALTKVRKSGPVQPLLSLVDDADHVISQLALDALMEVMPKLEEVQLVTLKNSTDSIISAAAFAARLPFLPTPPDAIRGSSFCLPCFTRSR